MSKRPCVKIESLEHALWVNVMLAEEFGVKAFPDRTLGRLWMTYGHLENFYLTAMRGGVKWGNIPNGQDMENRYWYDPAPTLDNV